MTTRLVVVTDRRLVADTDELCAKLDAMLGAAPALVQVREKDLGGRALLALVEAVLAVARRHGAPVVVNDRLDVALAAGADGVHLPEDGIAIADARAVAAAVGRTILVGCSRHDAAGVRRAAAEGADLILYGPIFATPGKGAPLGAAALRELAGTPGLCAIGGIDDAARAAEVRAAGVPAVAAIRALWTAADPAAAARALAG
jgi:thiamine-phosphate pyrophosphorylase